MAASDAFYNDLLLKVNPIIERFGTTYHVRGRGGYDSDTLTTTPATQRTVTGLVSTQAETFNLGSQIFAAAETSSAWIGKKNLLLTAAAAPLPGEEVQVDGKWFPLAKVNAIKPADITLLYILDVSR